MEPWLQMITTIICSVAASSGFWACILKAREKNDAERDLLIGLAHDRIMFLGLQYIERGWLSRDEYENLKEHLYKPYEQLYQSNMVESIMTRVDRLPIRSTTTCKPPDIYEDRYITTASSNN